MKEAAKKPEVALAQIKDLGEFAKRLQLVKSPMVQGTAKRLAEEANASAPFGPDKNKGLDQVSIQAYPLRSALWDSPQIEICWENPSTSFSAKMLDVQQAITNTWQVASRLRFTGWAPCPNVSPGNKQTIRIRIEDSGPHTKGLGKNLQARPQGMVLNLTFQNWSTSCQAMMAYCIKGIAVHEFGHAIGFAHEQNREDRPGDCMQPAQGTNGDDLLLTPYDPMSVMNYCNMQYNNDGKLSALDTAAVAALYGAP